MKSPALYASMIAGMLLTAPTVAVAQDLWIHVVSGCVGDGTANSWMIKNTTDHTISRNITQFYENDGVSSVNYKYPVTVGAREDQFLGCSAWSLDHVGRQSFSLGVSGGPPPPPTPPARVAPTPPPPPPPNVITFYDPRFRYLGRMGFSRPGGGTARTDAFQWDITLDPGMEIDTDYHQANEKRGPRFNTTIGNASSPLTINQIPAGFYIFMGGENYASIREPIVTKKTVTATTLGIASASASTPIFQMVLYCGPPAYAPCEVDVDVWVVQRPKRN